LMLMSQSTPRRTSKQGVGKQVPRYAARQRVRSQAAGVRTACDNDLGVTVLARDPLTPLQ